MIHRQHTYSVHNHTIIFETSKRRFPGTYFDFDTCNLPNATRLCLTVQNEQTSASKSAIQPLGWVNLQLFDDANRLRTGVIRLRLWPKEAANPIGTCVDNISTEQQHLKKTNQKEA